MPTPAWPRQVIPPDEGAYDDTLAVFCGVYGQRWIDNVIQSLERQSVAPVQVVLAINGRDSDAVALLTDYQRKSKHRVWVTVNETNLGPTGSFLRNHDLIQAPWTAFMHQDDEYLEGHLATIRAMALRATGDTVGLFTSLGGISEDGRRRLAPPPMENVALRGRPPWVVVPEIIRRHPFPTPAIAVRSDILVENLAWYDSGAPDSEWFARMACLGAFEGTDDVTVLYRQPDDSESATTDWAARAWLWSASINRILGSPEFDVLLRRVPLEQQSAFARHVIEAIPARYPSSPLFYYLQFVAAQRMGDAWDYREPVSVEFLSRTLGQWGRSGAARSLEAISGQALLGSPGPAVDKLLGSSPRATRLEATGRRAYRRYGDYLPPKIRDAALRIYRGVSKGAS